LASSEHGGSPLASCVSKEQVPSEPRELKIPGLASG
jgi:hypothetical protein